ncbi:Uncharacterised protein [Legionella lansingensis]|uniref:Uncharacterized protein n=2 Tax=Legionella lansingensis TaxID=45067 RepID=A0A0W0VF20_9GAMM|nr:hypothetical protein Llan_2324 [Legionella lansingensis]SNV57628.1 Uncharacterised protein [Legionella lansingensis]
MVNSKPFDFLLDAIQGVDDAIKLTKKYPFTTKSPGIKLLKNCTVVLRRTFLKRKAEGVMEINANLGDLHRALDMTEECFCDAVTTLASLPPELYEQGVASCERCLSRALELLEQFKKEVMEAN